LDYCQGEDSLIEAISLGRGQGIRYWLWGWFKQQGPNVKINLALIDTEGRHGQKNAEFIIKTPGKITDFEEDFFSWLEDCGIENLDGKITKSLWQEDTKHARAGLSGEGLRSLLHLFILGA